MFQHSHIMQCSDFNKPVSTKNPKSNVLFLIQFLPENGIRSTYIQAVHPDEDKVARMNGASAYFYRGTVLFPSIYNHFWNDFEKELLLFPNFAFKDQCDAFAQGVLYCAEIIAKPTARLVVL